MRLKRDGKYSLTQHMFEKGNEVILPGLHIFLLGVWWPVPVEQLEVTIQYCADLHLPLGWVAGVQKVDHCSQAPQGHFEQPRILGLLRG